jgi:dipeptidyl aminopeptidase/acylaminoacyl peptidase
MRAAQEKAGNPPEWMLKRGEAHGFYAVDNQVELYDRILAFLKKHIG